MKDDVTTTIRAPRAVLERLDVLARTNGGMRTQSDAIRWALTRGIEALEAEMQVPPSSSRPSDLSSEIAQIRARLDAIERQGS